MRTNSQQEAGALPANEFKVDSFIKLIPPQLQNHQKETVERKSLAISIPKPHVCWKSLANTSSKQ